MEFGFPLGLFSNPSVKCRKNHGGAINFPRDIDSYIAREMDNKCITGPFVVSPFQNESISPLNSVPQKDTTERWIILDLSQPEGRSVNDNISKDYYLGERMDLYYPVTDDLVALIKIKGRGCHLFKKDLKRAYRQIPIDPGDINNMGYVWNDQLYFDRVLTMGLRSACYICQNLTSTVRFIYNNMGFMLLNYLDDFAGVDMSELAGQAFEALGFLLDQCGFVESKEKSCEPSTIL